jgi:hypothetical protein
VNEFIDFEVHREILFSLAKKVALPTPDSVVVAVIVNGVLKDPSDAENVIVTDVVDLVVVKVRRLLISELE